MSSDTVPAGFHEHASGLIVPEAHARKRVVVSYEDWKRLDRALNVLNRIGLRMMFKCDAPDCSPIVKLRDAGGGATLRCDCTDRVFTKSF